MKRFLKKDKFQLGDHEKENLWLGIQAEARNDERASRSKFAVRPVLGLTTALAAVLALVVFLGHDEPTGPMKMNDMQIARHETTVPNAVSQSSLLPTPVKKSGEGSSRTSGLEEEIAAVDTIPDPENMVAEEATITGRVFAKETGDPLAFADILIVGTERGLTTDKDGHFQLDHLEPGKEVNLRVKYLGFEDEFALLTPSAGQDPKLEIGMEPMIVAVLEPFNVGGAQYMVKVKSTITDRVVSSETFEKFAIDSVNEALSKTAGVVSRAGELNDSSGRPEEFHGQKGGANQSPSTAPADVRNMGGSVTGGTTAPNGEPYELMYFDHTGVNPFVATEDDSLSTFAVDVDNASYTVARRYINGGSLPPQDAIRVEEFVNFFRAGYSKQSEDVFAINLDGAPSRFGSGYQLVRVGLQGKIVPADNRKPANLVFLVDISGSMARENRLGLVKHSLRILLDELREGDRVGIVVYGSHAEVRLVPTDITQRETILSAIDGLRTNGATNAYDGLQMAYHMARKSYQSHQLNRVILCSDGVANMGGSTQAEVMLEQIRQASDKGITLSTIGFGMGNYNDVLMEKLADQGDGNYYYVDQPKEAERVFRENLTGLLQTIARQVKVQVAFDDAAVKRWRLLGYENRDVADRDFRNDDVDAGEVGAGHQVTALYEIKLVDGLAENTEGHRLGEVHLRYEMPVHDSEQAGEVV